PARRCTPARPRAAAGRPPARWRNRRGRRSSTRGDVSSGVSSLALLLLRHQPSPEVSLGGLLTVKLDVVPARRELLDLGGRQVELPGDGAARTSAHLQVE